MRIVHITDIYPPRVHPIAGQVAGLARRQGARGDTVHVLAATPLDAVEPGRDRFRTSTTDAPGVRVHRLASPLALGLPVLPRGRATVERALRLLRPDVVHLHLPGASPFAYDAARAVRGLDLPMVISGYSATPEAFSKFAVKVTGWANVPVVTSGAHWAVATLAAEVFGDDDARLLPLGLPRQAWVDAGQRWRGGSQLRVLVRAGDLAKKFAPGITAANRSGAPLTVTVVGPHADDILEADVVLGDAPAEVMAPLAADHDVYLSAATLDTHEAGAAAAGMALIGPLTSATADLVGGGGIAGEVGARAGGFLVESAEVVGEYLTVLAGSAELLERMRTGIRVASPAADLPHDWAQVVAAADALYATARARVERFFID